MPVLSIDEITARIAELPVLPASVSEVITACDDPDITVGQISQKILQDQQLTASILKLANSAMYGLSRRVSTVTEAVVLLGFATIKSLAISSHTYRLLNRSLPGYGMQRGEIWWHSISVAMAARRIAVEVHLAPVEEAFVAGLLHDIGKTVLSGYMEDAFEEVIDIVQSERVAFSDAENRVLGYDHAELGARIARAWNFPPDLVEAIRFHHTPGAASLKPKLTYAVHLADCICMMLGIGIGADGLSYTVESGTLEALGLEHGRVEQIIDRLEPLLHEELTLD
ncbi:MAG: HDOD domain-containing protein [Actinomycetota bacterium]